MGGSQTKISNQVDLSFKTSINLESNLTNKCEFITSSENILTISGCQIVGSTINQTNYNKVNNECFASTEISQEVLSSLSTEIQQELKKETGEINNVINKILDPNAKTDLENKINLAIDTAINQTVNVTNECLTKSKTTNTIQCTDSTIYDSKFTQQNFVDQINTCVFDSAVFQKARSEITTAISQFAEDDQRGILAFLGDSLADIFKNIPLLIGAIVGIIVIILVIIIVIVLLTSKKSGLPLGDKGILTTPNIPNNPISNLQPKQ
jgi:hypothetical protein